jgi:integrase
MLSLRLEDYDPDRMQITFRRTKTDRPRTVPISRDWREAVDAYLRVRPRCDSPVLFISRTGLPLSVTSYGTQFRHYADFAGVAGWSLHGLRHYALSQIARTSVLAAQQIAGHTSLVVTQGYLHTGADQVRAAHAEAAPLSRLLVNRRSEEKKRKRLV